MEEEDTMGCASHVTMAMKVGQLEQGWPRQNMANDNLGLLTGKLTKEQQKVDSCPAPVLSRLLINVCLLSGNGIKGRVETPNPY